MTAKRAPGSRSPLSTRSIPTTTAATSGAASKNNGDKTQPSSVAVASSTVGKTAQASGVTTSSVKSTQSGAAVVIASSSSGKGNGGRAQLRSEDSKEHQEREEGDAEVPMDFPREQIKLGKEFGEGEFGKVFQAEAKKLLPGRKKTMVVVKQLKEGATKEERDVFLRPVEAMK